MDAISSWAKENYQLICLLVSIIGVIVGIITVIVEMKKKKKEVVIFGKYQCILWKVYSVFFGTFKKSVPLH